MDDIYNTLNGYLKSNTKNRLNQAIARCMLASLFEIPRLRAADIAQRCYTSAPSVIRFCRELRYDGYTDLKDAADHYCQNVRNRVLVPDIPLRMTGSEEEYHRSLEQWTCQMQQLALRALQAIDHAQLQQLARDLLQYRYVYLFGIGLSAQICEQLRVQLARSGKIVLTTDIPDTSVPLSASKADTVAVIFSQHGRFLGFALPDAFAYLQKYCAKTWLVTQEPPGRAFAASAVLHVMPSPSLAMEYHTMIYVAEMLGQCCRELLGGGPHINV